MRFYPGIDDQALWGDDPIPTPRLDVLYEQMIVIEAEEQLDKLAIRYADPKVYGNRLRAILDNRTEDEKIEGELSAYRALAAMTGKTISAETEEAYRRGTDARH